MEIIPFFFPPDKYVIMAKNGGFIHRNGVSWTDRLERAKIYDDKPQSGSCSTNKLNANIHNELMIMSRNSPEMVGHPK